jgi:cyclase
MKLILRAIRLISAALQVLLSVLAMTVAAPPVVAQKGANETVTQTAIEQFENNPLISISLGKDVFMFSGDGGDVLAIAAQDSTLLIDSGISSRVSELSDAINKTTWRPVTRLVSTHWHFDHTGGNVYFGSGGVEIIAQENVKKRLSSTQNLSLIGLHDGPYPPEAIPTVTYSSSTTLSQGSQRLTLVNYGPAHTDGDTVIYIAPANVAVVGDIFSNRVYPVIDLASGGSIEGMIHSLDQVLSRIDEQTKIVPGHGPLAARADLEDYRDMLLQVRQRVKALISAGKTIDQAVAAGPTKDYDSRWGGGYLTPEIFTRMVFSSLADVSATR